MDGDQHKRRRGRSLLGVVLVAPLLICACTAGPERVGEDFPSASARDGANRLVRIYDVRDLLAARAPSLQNVLDTETGAGGHRLSEQSEVQADGSDAEPVAQLKKQIRDKVGEPEQWRKTADSPALHELLDVDGRIIFHSTPEGHEALEALLRKWRSERTKSMRVQLELQYLLLNEDAAKAALNDVDEHRAEVATPEGEHAPNQAYLLNNVQTDRLIRAAKASDASASLTAPRLTAFPGQAVRAETMKRTKYLQAYEVVNDEPTPIFGTSRRGVAFRGGGEVTENRRYVDLQFRASVTTATGPMERVEPYPDSSSDQQAFVERPRKARWETSGKATVPDQATLLLVGDKIEGSVMLSDKKLEGKRPRFGQRRRVLLLVRPSIIMHQPAQARSSSQHLRE